MISSSLVLKAVIDKLNAVLTPPVYNAVPQNSDLPFVRVQLDDIRDNATKTEDSLRFGITVDIWSNYEGDREVLDLTDQVIQELDQSTLTGVNEQSLSLSFSNYDTVLEPDGKTHHTIMNFQYIETE